MVSLEKQLEDTQSSLAAAVGRCEGYRIRQGALEQENVQLRTLLRKNGINPTDAVGVDADAGEGPGSEPDETRQKTAVELESLLRQAQPHPVRMFTEHGQVDGLVFVSDAGFEFVEVNARVLPGEFVGVSFRANAADLTASDWELLEAPKLGRGSRRGSLLSRQAPASSSEAGEATDASPVRPTWWDAMFGALEGVGAALQDPTPTPTPDRPPPPQVGAPPSPGNLTSKWTSRPRALIKKIGSVTNITGITSSSRASSNGSLAGEDRGTPPGAGGIWPGSAPGPSAGGPLAGISGGSPRGGGGGMGWSDLRPRAPVQLRRQSAPSTPPGLPIARGGGGGGGGGSWSPTIVDAPPPSPRLSAVLSLSSYLQTPGVQSILGTADTAAASEPLSPEPSSTGNTWKALQGEGVWQMMWQSEASGKQAILFQASHRTRAQIQKQVDEWGEHSVFGGDASTAATDGAAAAAPAMAVLEHLVASTSYTPPGAAQSHLITPDMASALAHALPGRQKVNDWTLLYGTDKGGFSLQTMYRNAAGCSRTILLVEDFQGYVFGAFLTSPWRVNPRYQGTGESFAFQLCPHMIKFPWQPPAAGAPRNDFFCLVAPDSVGIGGGPHFAMWLDSDLLHGHAGACLTFGCPLLAGSEHFKVKGLELWQVGAQGGR